MSPLTPTTWIGILFLLSQCSTEYPDSGASANANGFVAVSKSLEIGSEKFLADYASIHVPENRSDSGSRLITIPVLRIHSKSKNPGEPVLVLTGGPGNSNMSWDLELALSFLDERDFLMIGYRGVDGSSILDCPEVTRVLREGDPLGDECMKRIGQAWRDAATRFKAEGVDIDGYTMPECIEDFEAVRKALGYEHINLLSRSYGTRVAYLYGLKHPDRIFRSAMISVNPPGRFVWEPQMIDAQLRYYSALWSEDSVMIRKSPDLYKTISNVLKNMPRQWLGIPIVPGKVRIATFALLYHRKTAAQVFDAFVAAEHGDASGLAMISLAYDFVVPSLMVWGDAAKAESADFDSTRNYSVESDPTAAMPMGSPLGKLLWGPMKYGRLNVTAIPDTLRRLQPSEVETLLISGSIDFSTPAEYATRELLPYLRNGKQVIISECGHTGDVLNSDIGNVVPLLRNFYRTGETGVITNKYLPMNFNVKMGFPAIAKATAGIVIFFIILLVVWLFKKMKGRRSATRNITRRTGV